MPRNVRNFWIELDVDGRKSRIETGPRSKDGGFNLSINMRDEECIKKNVFEIHGYRNGEKLHLLAHDADLSLHAITSRD